MLIRPLDHACVDIVGDVHGEIESLQALLDVLGYSPHEKRTDGRQLIFLGDLVDRGPDSLAVVRLVKCMVQTGAACILGNHELNILREERKPDNAWFFDTLQPAERDEVLDFLQELPLAFEKKGQLRVVHACWDTESIDAAGAYRGKAIDFFKQREAAILDAPEDQGLKARAEQQKKRRPREQCDPKPEMLHELAEWELRQQLRNPIKLLTSGVERKAGEPSWINGKYRYTERVNWWDTYDGEELVVVGHYWRSRHRNHQFVEGPDPFVGTDPEKPLGPAQRVMCIDYSIGGRSKERSKSTEPASYRTALAACRVHENGEAELVFSPV